MGYEVELWIDDFAIAPQVESDFGSLVWYFSERQGVPLPSPAYDLYVYDGPDSLAASRPDRAEIRRRLRTSPLLDQLDIDDMGRLVASARPARFSSGEVVFSSTELSVSSFSVLITAQRSFNGTAPPV